MKFFFIFILSISLNSFSQDKNYYDNNFIKTFNYLEANDYYKSSKLIDSILIVAENENNLNEQARFLVLKASIYENVDDIKTSEEYNLKAMALFKNSKNEYMYNWTYSIVLANYMYNKNYNKFYENLPIIKNNLKDDFLLFYVYEMELRALFNQKKHDELLNIVGSFISELKHTHFRKEEYQKEIYRYMSIYNLLKTFSLMEKGKLEKHDKSLNELMKIKFNDLFWLEENDLKYESMIYQYKIQLLLKNKTYDSASYFHQKYILTSKKFIDFIRKDKDKMNKIMNKILENERKIINKNTKLKIQKQKTKNLLIASSSLIVLTLLILFSVYRYKQAKVLIIKNHKIKLLNSVLHEKNNNLKLKNKKNKDLIALNERSIFSKTVQLSTLRDNLGKIINTIKKLTEDNSTVNSVELFRIENALSSIIDENDIWEEFKIQFEKIRPNFFNELKKINPKLTVNDLKHCSYVIINLKVKDVANLINVSPRSVETVRYRLRKKLNIPTKTKLYNFLNLIDKDLI